MIQILIVDDEKPICDLIQMSLTRAGYHCTCVYDGLAAADILERNVFDLILLDVMLPNADGFELMEYIRPLGIPVIFLTARGSVDDRVRGLRMGAEDYIVKPFEVVELLARVDVVLRRYNKTDAVIEIGGLRIDTRAMQVWRGAEEISLTHKEYDLLLFFARNPGTALYRETIYEHVWGGEYSYLKGKADPYEEKDKDKWSVTLTPAEVKTRLTNAGYSIGTVAKVEVTKRTATNNVAEVTVTDTDGKKVTLTRSSVRTVFGLKSINYSITANTAATSSQTKTAVQKTASATKTSVKISPSVHTVTVDGKVVKPQGYNINDNNYYKLRDVAWILNGTGSEFNVTWDGANNRILLSPNAPYVKVGGEMSDTVAAVKKLSPSTAAVAVGNKTVQLTGYNVNDNNYYKLRDIGDALGFAVDWDPEGVVVIRSADKTTDDSKNDTSDGNNGGNSSSDQNNSNNNTGNDGQTAETAASWTFSGAGWGHSVGMSQWGAYAMAKQGFSYEDILKFYFTGIEISK